VGQHCCLTPAWAHGEEPVPTAKLAVFFEGPPAYLDKSLQVLVRAGTLASNPANLRAS
jgi:DNA-binding IscR family transcriptional regulator